MSATERDARGRDFVLEGLCVRIGGRQLLRDASACFAAGAVHAVIGHSGAGKSVLMKAAVGLHPASAGVVRLGDESVDAGDADGFARLRERVVFVHQEPALLDERTVRENLAFAARRKKGLSAAVVAERVARWLDALALAPVASLPCHRLSGGLLRKVALGRALCLAPEVLVVDEPTTGLDPVAAEEVNDALTALKGLGSTLVLITHDLRSLERLRPSLTYVEDGAVRYRDSDRARASDESSAAAQFAVDGGRPPSMRALLEGSPRPREEAPR